MASKRKPTASQAANKAIREQQREEAKALRQRQKDAIKRQKELDKIARVRLRNIHKAQRKRARQQQKENRRRAAILKRKGLLRPDFDVRGLKKAPRSLLRLFKKYAKVIKGKETTYKVPPNKVKELKAKGYTVENNRVILQKSLMSRGGKIYTANKKIVGTGGIKENEIRHIKLGKHFKTQLTEAFNGLGDDEYIAFSINGYHSYNLYQDQAELEATIARYGIGQYWTVKDIYVFKITDPAKYHELKQKEIHRLQETKVARRKKRLKTFKKGLRTIRGT